MKSIFKPGDQKVYKKVVDATDLAAFHNELVHPVCSTFALARDFEWTSRLFALEMKEDHEECVGTFLSIEHKGPAFEGEEITFAAKIIKINGQDLTCSLSAFVNDRKVAEGTTGQRFMRKERLKEIFKH
jgi:fluoroacetyl-CoA thioesterase